MKPLALAAAAGAAHAQDRAAELDKIFGWVKRGMLGCAAAASQQRQLVVNGAYGLADIERGVRLTSPAVRNVKFARQVSAHERWN